MKKLFSLLTLALLTMSAWAQTTVTFDFTTGYENGEEVTSVSSGDVTIAFDKGTGSTVPAWYTTGAAIRVYAKGTITVSAATGYQVTGVTYTFGSGDNTNEITANVGTYTEPTWTGGAAEVVFTVGGTSKHRRIAGMTVTIDEAPAFPLPVFTPAGGEFDVASLAVTVSTTVDDASIYVYKVVDGEIDYTTGQYFFESGEIYVTETSTYAAYAYKGSEYSDYAYASYTKVMPTCAAPTFTPNNGATFEDSETVRIDCETEGATIMYQVNDEEWEMEDAPVYIELEETATIKAIAMKDGYNDSPEVSATFTKVEPYTVGGTATFVAGVDSDPNVPYRQEADQTIVKDNVTMQFHGTHYNYYNVNQETGDTTWTYTYRIYKGQNITFTSAAGNIRKIEFDCESSNPVTGFNAVPGLDMTTGVWEGNAPTITFTAGGKQVRCYTITVTLDDAAPALVVVAPVFDPVHNTTFIGSQDVTITSETEGADIYYSIDEKETWNLYEAPVTLTETTVVYAYAQVDTVQSAIVSAKYYKATIVNNIEEALALDENTDFAYMGEAVVTYQNGLNTWIKDATGYGLIYGTVPEMAQGTVIADSWMAYLKDYYGVPEFASPKNVVASEDVVTVEPEVKETITNDDVNMYIIMKNQTLTIDQADTTNNTWLNVDELKFYDKFGVDPVIEEGKNYDVVGVVTIYKSAPEVYIISVTEAAPAGLRGDVNKDGEIDIADVTALIAHVLSKDYTESDTFSPGNADVNFDTVIDIADVTVLINRVLSKSW